MAVDDETEVEVASDGDEMPCNGIAGSTFNMHHHVVHNSPLQAPQTTRPAAIMEQHPSQCVLGLKSELA